MKPTLAQSHLQDSQKLFTQLQQDTEGFEILAKMLKSLSGINLPINPKNISLMAGRLCSLIKSYDLSGYEELAEQIKSGNDDLCREFIFSMTTNTTSFFRERAHFSMLASLLPGMMEKKRRKNDYELRVWCAAASFGHEPYTILITILETLELNNNWSLKFLATDIDMDALKKAATATYSENDLEGVESLIKQKYFTKVKRDNSWFFQFDPKLAKLIRFAPFNLMTNPYEFQHKFDVVFCRNVLIYFDQETCHGVLTRLLQSMNVGGYLFIGHAEAGNMRNQKVKVISHAAYERV